MTIRDFDRKSPNPLTTVLKRVAGPFKVARKGGSVVVRQLPPTLNAAWARTKMAGPVQRGIGRPSGGE
jgi:hypothetical protein